MPRLDRGRRRGTLDDPADETTSSCVGVVVLLFVLFVGAWNVSLYLFRLVWWTHRSAVIWFHPHRPVDTAIVDLVVAVGEHPAVVVLACGAVAIIFSVWPKKRPAQSQAQSHTRDEARRARGSAAPRENPGAVASQPGVGTPVQQQHQTPLRHRPPASSVAGGAKQAQPIAAPSAAQSSALPSAGGAGAAGERTAKQPPRDDRTLLEEANRRLQDQLAGCEAQRYEREDAMQRLKDRLRGSEAQRQHLEKERDAAKAKLLSELKELGAERVALEQQRQRVDKALADEVSRLCAAEGERDSLRQRLHEQTDELREQRAKRMDEVRVSNQLRDELQSSRRELQTLRKSLAGQAENKQCTLCVVCQDADKNCVLGCGHRTCVECAAKLQHCPVCRAKIEARIRLFDL